jgi:hypothetical protein
VCVCVCACMCLCAFICGCVKTWMVSGDTDIPIRCVCCSHIVTIIVSFCHNSDDAGSVLCTFSFVPTKKFTGDN